MHDQITHMRTRQQYSRVENARVACGGMLSRARAQRRICVSNMGDGERANTRIEHLRVLAVLHVRARMLRLRVSILARARA